nr:hypothetical protein [Tanacetum cinerariifolium]
MIRHQIPQHNSKWTKDHPLDNIIDQQSRPVSTRLQLHDQALFCYYNAFLTSVEPKTYKNALTQSYWIEAMQEELNEFERLERDTVSSPESAPTFAELFKINDLKAQVQEKDTVILKLKEKLKSFSGDVKERKVEREVEEIETLNLELDHKVTKLAAETEHLKQTYKQLFDSINSSHVQSKEHCDDLINKVNPKSVEVSDLNASLQ